MKITAVRCFQVTGPANHAKMEARQVGMLDVYPEFAARPHVQSSSPQASAIYVEIGTDEGPTGLFGPIFEETVTLILGKLKPQLIGRDPLAYEKIWDVLYRQDRHARGGNQMMAISAVDNALWDLRGKIFNLPIYRLLGGPTRERVDCYASMLGFSHDPGLVRERAQMVVAQGFKAQKWFFRYGLTEGLEGMGRNVALIRTVREAVGPNIDIMVDAWMGWDATYAIRMLERIAEFRPRWLEEPVPPDRFADLAAIRRSSNVPIATGEHEYNRWNFLHLIQAEAVDVIQADPDWCGGISELVKIGSIASAFGKQMIPHGHSIHPAVNVIASQSPVTFPMAEYLLLHQPSKQQFHRTVMYPEGGSIALPTEPGLGFALDDAKIEQRVELT